MASFYLTFLLWLGHCLVILEIHQRLNIQTGNQAVKLGRDWPKERP